MTDPLTEVVTLLQPGAPSTKRVSGAGRWVVQRSEAGRPFYAAVLDGTCLLTVGGGPPSLLEPDDFVLIPSAYDFTVSSPHPPREGRGTSVTIRPDGEVRHGDPDGPPDVRLLVGYCTFGSPDAGLLVSLLPDVVHAHGERRLSTLVGLVRDEARAARPGRDVVFARLFEVLLIEALRVSTGTEASPGLLRGLADDHLAVPIRRMHEHPDWSWTTAGLATEGALSRSAFAERFKRVVGIPPMAYLLGWRMALAKRLLRDEGGAVAEVAERVGYSSASAFSVAFTRETGQTPARFARDRP